jgi:hypothetical protein
MNLKNGVKIMNERTYAIQIKDNSGTVIGEKMDASVSDILCYISKNLKVFDMQSGSEITEQAVTSRIGVSDGLIMA